MTTIGRGVFIAIEGTDGSGKGTQCKQLAERLADEGHDVAVFDFPQYDQPSSFFVGEYLNGRYGGADDVGPYTASLFYALDRYQAAPKIREALAQGKVVLANRFVGSSMAHQGTKFQHAEERRGFFIWLDNLEFEMLQIPRPTVSIVLRMPAETAQQLVGAKDARGYTDKKLDIHEADLSHMQRSVTVYDDLCQLFPSDFSRIDCVRNNAILDIETIHGLVWQKVVPLLPAKRGGAGTITHMSAPAQSPAATAAPAAPVDLPVPQPETSVPVPVPATKEIQASDTVTTLESKVYAFTARLSHDAAVAVMTRLANGSDALPAILEQVIADSTSKDEVLQRRTIELHGEGPVRKLTAIHLMIEQPSNLLAAKIEQGRSTAHLDLLTQDVAFERRDAQDRYRYYVPDYLEPKIKEQYVAHMDQLFNLYGEILQGITGHLQQQTAAASQDAAWQRRVHIAARKILRPVLPLAAAAPVGIYATGEALERLIVRLMSDPHAEARKVGESILVEARKIAPAFMERVATPERGGAALAYRATTSKKIKRLAAELLPDHYANPSQAVQLTEVWPRNELEIVPEILYKHSSLALQELRTIAQGWPYTTKSKVLDAYINERPNHHHYPGRALEKVHYSWDITCDFDTLRRLQQRQMTDAAEIQEPTPRYGYDMPDIVEAADMADQYEACFDLSLRLYSILQGAGYTYEAQYATLLGHKVRGKFTHNAREAFLIHTAALPHNESAAYHAIVRAMYERISEVHPQLAEAMHAAGPVKKE
jgi:dTMP kinase